MMIVVGSLRLSGFFERLTGMALRRIATPQGLLAVTIGLSGVLSAFLINDVVCVALTPLVLHLARRMKFDPVPHLIGLATAANIGSTGTITGNPQNIYIGAHSGISYLRFAARLLPVALLGCWLNYLVVCLVYRSRLAALPAMATIRARSRASALAARGRARPSQLAPCPAAAQGGGGHAGRRWCCSSPACRWNWSRWGRRPSCCSIGSSREKIYRQVDWSLLVMFTGLFIVVHAFQVHVVARLGHRALDLAARPSGRPAEPGVGRALEPGQQRAGGAAAGAGGAGGAGATRETAWLALAMSSTLAGNLTVLGSVANLIVVENARREGVTISFWEYCKVGVPLTLLTLAIGIGWLHFVQY